MARGGGRKTLEARLTRRIEQRSPSRLRRSIGAAQAQAAKVGLEVGRVRKPVVAAPGLALRRRDIVQYANSHECVASVVIDSLEGWESVAEDRGSDPWARLACPLVTAAPPKTSGHDRS